MAIQRRSIDTDRAIDLAEAVMGPPRTVGELRIILEDFNSNKPNEWFGIEEARKAVSNLYWLLFRKSPNFEDWDGIVKELGGELDRRAKKGENWEVRPLSEIDNEVARVWNEALKRPEFETRALNSKQLEVLLRDLDDHLLEQGKIDEATNKLTTRYGLDKGGRELLAQAIARKVEIQREIRAKLIGEGRSAIEARREADVVSDIKTLIEARVGEGKIEPKEMAEVVAKEVAVVLEIERKLEGETGQVVELVRETEARLRPELGDKAVEVAVAVANGAKPEEVLLPELKAEARKRVARELEITAKVVEVERQIEVRAGEITARLAEVLGVNDSKVVEEIRQEVRGRVVASLDDGEGLNRPVDRMVMTEKLDEVVGTNVPEEKKGKVASVLRDAEKKLEQYQDQFGDVLAWRERHKEVGIFKAVVVANPSIEPVIAERFAENAARPYGPTSGVLEEERRVWQEARLAGEITPLDEARLKAFTHIIRSEIAVTERIRVYETSERQIDVGESVEARGYQDVVGAARDNPGLAAMMERARLMGGNFAQNFALQQLGKIEALRPFVQFLGGQTGGVGGIGFAKEAIGLLKGSESLAGGLKAVLGLASGGGGGAVTGKALLGLAAKLGLGATGPVGWIVGLAGGLLGKLGLQAGLKGLIRQAPALLGRAAGAMVGFASGLMTTISGALAGLSISSVAVWGPIVAILVFILIIIGPLISAMLPPGRGMGGGVVDQTTLNGGYLAAPAWSGDINDLPDSCPPDSLPIGGTVTQGPEAIGCSHAPYKNTIDVATNNTSATATHDGVVETVANMGSGYGQFVDIRAKCNSVVFVTRYAHLAVGLQQVAKGQKITRGTVVGLTDNSGNSTGPHLHYEIRGLTTDHFAKWSGCCVDNGIACQN